MDCRYCHGFVEVAAHSNVPDTQVCMNCHTQVQKDNPKLEPVRVELEDRPAGRVGADPSHARLRLLQSLGARESRDQLLLVATARSITCRWSTTPNRTAWRGASNAIAQPENFLRPEDQITNLDWKPDDVKPAEFVAKYGQPQGVKDDWSKKTNLTQHEIGQTLKERWNIQAAAKLPGVSSMKRILQHPARIADRKALLAQPRRAGGHAGISRLARARISRGRGAVGRR